MLIDKTIEELLQKGFIRPSTSPYAFPIVMAPKKDGTKRMCIDYKPLNKIMIRDSYPLPLIDDCLEKLEGQRYFTTLDANTNTLDYLLVLRSARVNFSAL